jgi:hypothetical protein
MARYLLFFLGAVGVPLSREGWYLIFLNFGGWEVCVVLEREKKNMGYMAGDGLSCEQ